MEQPKSKTIPDEKTALAKAEHYCAYQERSQQEVRDKLYEMGLHRDAVEHLISLLIGDNFLNEERFAKAYVQGKFKQKQWGRIKIKQGLKLKKVSDVLIKKTLLTISGDEYFDVLKHILFKKAKVLTEKNSYKRRNKLQLYAQSRGFELDMILDILKTSDLEKK